MAESAELADKLQGSVCRLTSVPVNFKVCDWGATDIHWLQCEHKAGGCSSSIYQYRRFGLLWFWKRFWKSSQGPVKHVNLNRPLNSTSEQNNNDQGIQVIQSTRTVLLEQWGIRRCMRVRRAELSTGTPLLGEGWGTGAQCRLPMGTRRQESRAGQLGHCGSRQTFTLVILPLGQALLPRTNSTAKRTWVRGENSTASLSSPWNRGLFLLSTGQLLRGRLGSEVTGLATESSSSWLS